MRAWHFCRIDPSGRPVLRDGSLALGPGEVETYDGPLVLYRSGLQASVRALDALSDAPGAWVRQVECAAEAVIGDVNLVCRRRAIIAHADATEVLREWARWCAFQVAHLWACPAITREWLETGNPALREAALEAAARKSRSAWAAAAVDAAAWAAAADEVAWVTRAARVAAARSARSAVEAAEARAVAETQNVRLEAALCTLLEVIP